jgi:uncharacterized protein affecting Mg2+/Co2+ transport
MKRNKIHLNRAGFGVNSAITAGLLAVGALTAQGSTDYGPAIWRPTCPSHFYVGYTARQVYVIHDMEGYYASTISYLQGCNNTVSVHYAVNGVQDTGTDMPAGEITQMVRDSDSAWTSGCWNRYAEQTEHEGFANNPAWYTEAMYQASGALTQSKANKYGIPKDRNHIIAHGQKLVPGWSTWAAANLSFNANCNSHTDPGPYWDWNHYMALVGGTVNNAAVVSSSYPSSVTVGQVFTATVVMNNNGTRTWSTTTSHGLGSQNAQDNTRWGLGRVGLGAVTSPGQNATFTFNCTAPSTPGTYPFDWKMVQDGVEWFGATATGSITVNATPPPNVIVDNADAGFSVTGSWATGSSSTDKYGADYRYHSTVALSEPAQWLATVSGGAHTVYAWWPQGANRHANAAYTVYHSAGSTVVNVNQQVGGGQWNSLGSFSLNSGSNKVLLSCWNSTGYIVVADAIKWQ